MEQDLTYRLLMLVGDADRLILWLLIALSVLATAIIIERALVFGSMVRPLRAATGGALSRWTTDTGNASLDPAAFGELEPLIDALQRPGPPAPVRRALLDAETGRLRRRLMQRAAILGTLGANTPFIGLLGTVFGVIRAFVDLAGAGGSGGGQAVMAGIAQALVATGLGLAVAIPCVLTYNAFARRAIAVTDELRELGALLIAAHGGDEHGD